MTFGDLELLPLLDGFLGLDGGAMFGVVPKPLWEKRAPADERNRVRLAMRPLVVRGAQTVLIDAGIGSKMDAKSTEIYAIDRRHDLHGTLRDAGLSPADIDVVLATHLHFDHAGGFTERDAAGGLRPAFPNARYLVRGGEWEDARQPHERNRASYLAENYEPLQAAGVLDLFDEDRVIMPGVRVVCTGGHTAHHQIVYLESGGLTAVFAADLLPTAAHVEDPWIMGYDLYPMETLVFKRRFVREAIAREHLIFFEHDPAIAAGVIRERDGRRIVEPRLEFTPGR